MLDWLYPQTIAKTQSKFNGEIKIVKTRGQFAFWVGGFEQSGPMVESLWKKALKNLDSNVKNILILGLGGGSVIKLLTLKWPYAKVVGVEVDQTMIKLGKKYFSLAKTPNLLIVNNDAKKFLSTKRKKFDLVLVDTYRGNKFRLNKKEIQGLGKLVIVNQLSGTRNYLHFLEDGRRRILKLDM